MSFVNIFASRTLSKAKYLMNQQSIRSLRNFSRQFGCESCLGEGAEHDPFVFRSSEAEEEEESENKKINTLISDPISLIRKGQVNYTPSETVELLNKYVIGQTEAKKAVSVALRNRWRRLQLPNNVQNEVYPKNIIMTGPTGCGKSELCRRLASISDAPFVKAEATKYTEVGYYGKDVETIIKDLTESSMRLCKKRLNNINDNNLDTIVNEKIIKYFTKDNNFGYEIYKQSLEKGELEESLIPVEVPAKKSSGPQMQDLGNGMAVGLDIMSLLGGGAKKKVMKKVRDARPLMKQAEIDKLISRGDIEEEAVRMTEQNGIVFIDEIDKLITVGSKHNSDASSEGVQRDLLPLVEGTVVNTKYGPVNTNHILFISAGAFHESKYNDLLPELQGRFPIRVDLKALTESELYRILKEPELNLIQQQTLLLKTEDIDLEFTDESLKEMARFSYLMNETHENIGARRLHSVVESVVEEFSFNSEKYKNQKVIVDVDYIQKIMNPLATSSNDYHKYIL
ncbi:hypothetical protein WA158_001699 [Blastocystis sp. Blastoise]